MILMANIGLMQAMDLIDIIENSIKEGELKRNKKIIEKVVKNGFNKLPHLNKNDQEGIKEVIKMILNKEVKTTARNETIKQY